MRQLALSAFVVCFSFSSWASSSPTCSFRGRGETHDASGAIVAGQGFGAQALRTQISGGRYFIQETRVFGDGRKESFAYTYQFAFGLLNGSTESLSFVANCVSPGYCVGYVRGPVLSGDVTLEFSDSLIRTTLRHDGLVTHEYLAADDSCFFQ